MGGCAIYVLIRLTLGDSELPALNHTTTDPPFHPTIESVLYTMPEGMV